MTNFETLYPNLKIFFSGYFHQDWMLLYDWGGGEPSFEVVVLEFKKRDATRTNKTINELEDFIGKDLSEVELRRIVNRDLGCSIYAPGLDLTYRQWLEAVLEILKKTS